MKKTRMFTVLLLVLGLVSNAGSQTASNPIPPNGSEYDQTWVQLGWLAGAGAVSHDVYFGESFTDVDSDTGTGVTFRGRVSTSTFVIGFPGYPYPDGLVNCTTYYWRIDEVYPNIVYKGDVWSFHIMLPGSGQTIYVDADAPGANNGSSWTDAYRYLQTALNAASCGDEIRVAQGIYKPDRGGGITPGDRTATFQLKNHVAIKGGYAGYGAANPNDRDIETYETILSGDLVGNDADVADPRDLEYEPTRSENSYHVVTGSGTVSTAVLDGFTVTGGNANGPWQQGYYNGGGMYNESGNPTVTNCTFSGNTGFWAGGGMYNDSSSPTVTNCTFSVNSAVQGGGMYNERNSSPNVTSCTFTGNLLQGTEGSYGGGMYNINSSPTVTKCIFSNNSAGGVGGGMCNQGDSNPNVINCVFRGNLVTGWNEKGGGMYNGHSSPTVTNCTFKGNSAEQLGGGIYNWESSPGVTNCILWDNSDAGGLDESAQIHNEESSPNLSYSCVRGWTGALGGIGNIGSNPSFADADGRLSASSPCIDAGNNGAVSSDITTDLDGNPRIINDIVDMGAYEFGSGLTCITPPAPPTSITAIEGSGAGKIVLTWNPSTCATGYKIFYDEDTSNPPFSPTQDGNPASGSDVGNVTQVTITGLTPGQNYCFAVKAYNAVGESDYSAQDCATASSQIVTCSYAVVARVILLVDNPRETTNLPAGTCGTVLCTDSADPELPLLVSWDEWSGGYNVDLYCDYPPPRYPNNSAYWMACDQIAPGCTEGYFDECGVFVLVGDCVFFDADGGGRYLVNTYDFQVGDRVRVRGLWTFCLTFVCGPPDGCIKHAIVSYCDGTPSSPCCSPPYSPGDRVRLLVSNPRGAVGLVAGMTGTVICCDYDDPELPIFVSWDDWSNGRNSDIYCDSAIWSYPAYSGWWMACDEIGPVAY